VDGFRLVIAVTVVFEVDRAVWSDGDRAGIPMNAVDA
jgi:hypothetical protein